MKRLLSLLLLLPMFATAQSIEVRAFGGLMLNSATNHHSFDFGSSKLNPLGGAGISYRSNHVEVGLNIGYRRFSFQRTFLAVFGFDPVTGKSTNSYEVTRVFKEPALAISPALNYHFGRGRLDWYAGLTPSFIRYTGNPTFNGPDGANGWALEGQVGASYAIVPKFRLFAELSGGAVWIPYNGEQDNRIWTGGINIGAQLRVWSKKPATLVPAEAPESSAAE